MSSLVPCVLPQLPSLCLFHVVYTSINLLGLKVVTVNFKICLCILIISHKASMYPSSLQQFFNWELSKL